MEATFARSKRRAATYSERLRSCLARGGEPYFVREGKEMRRLVLCVCVRVCAYEYERAALRCSGKPRVASGCIKPLPLIVLLSIAEIPLFAIGPTQLWLPLRSPSHAPPALPP